MTADCEYALNAKPCVWHSRTYTTSTSSADRDIRAVFLLAATQQSMMCASLFLLLCFVFSFFAVVRLVQRRKRTYEPRESKKIGSQRSIETQPYLTWHTQYRYLAAITYLIRETEEIVAARIREKK